MLSRLLIIFSLLLLMQSSFALTYEELETPAHPAARLGVGEGPEKMVVKAKIPESTKSVKSAKIGETKDLTYADLSLKKISDDITMDVEFEQDVLLRELALLWASAAQNSETVKYTIYKLSNPDENKPTESRVKKIIRPIASFSTIAGTAFAANPFVASGALIGGNLLNAFSTDSKEANYQFTKVKDADMVILVRKIDDLQKRLMVLYLDYKTKQRLNEMAVENLKKRADICAKMQNTSRERVLLADSYFRSAQSFASKAHNEYIAARNILEQLVGTQALNEIERTTSASK